MGGVAYLSLEDSEVCYPYDEIGFLLIVAIFIILGAI
jgi:hypothetical protein